MTVSELARALDLNKSTVHEHLAKLVEGGLIKRDASEEREFVYYDLTRTAHYVLQPSSARFVLLMGSLVAAGLLGLLLLNLALTAHQGLALGVEEPIAPAGEATLWTAQVSQPGFLGFRAPAEQARLYLLDADEAADLQLTGQLPQDATPLGAAEGLQRTAPGRYAFRAALDPGVHYLLARQPGLPDALFPLRAQPVEIVPERSIVLVGVDSPRVAMDVRFRGAPMADGFVQAIDPASGRELAEVPVVNGRAVLELAGAAENVSFRFRAAEPGSAFAPAEGLLQAPQPHVAFGPALVPLGVRTDVRVVVDDPLQGPRAGAPVTLVRADGRTVANATTDDTGAGRLGVRLREAGEFVLKAGDLEVGRIVAQPGLRLWQEPGPHWEGELVRVRALEMGREPEPVPGAAILLDGRQVGLTQKNGELALQFAFGGSYAVEVRREGWVPAAGSIEVLPRTGYVLQGVVQQGLAQASLAAPSEAPPAPHVEAPAQLAVGETGEVRALVANPDDLPRVLHVELREDGRLLASRGVPVPAKGVAWVSFPYAPTAAGAHRIQVDALPPQAVVAYRAQAAGAAVVDYNSLPGPELWLLLPGVAALALAAGQRRP